MQVIPKGPVFNAGDVVKCINDSNSPLTGGRPYTVLRYDAHDDMVLLEDLPNRWFTYRFRICEESIIDKILKKYGV
jgi:hypothetical protein